MKSILIFLFVAFFTIVASRLSSTGRTEFAQFIETFNKNYATADEFETRLSIFKENFKRLVTHNSNTKGFQMGINGFYDMTPDEFSVIYLGGLLKKSNGLLVNSTGCSLFVNSGKADMPDSVDWTRENAVTSVKNQGQCGSCWAFSAVGAVEGAIAIATGELKSFSVQQIIDSSIKYGNMACHGGLPNQVFQYAKDSADAVCVEDEYPAYSSGTTGRISDFAGGCSKTYHFVTGCANIAPNNQMDLKYAVSFQPVSVAINANNLQLYESGIIMPSDCDSSPSSLNHAVLITGYGVENDVPYWIVKNSYGEDWGEKGYFRVFRSDGKDNGGTCGLALSASFPIVTIV